MIHSKNNVKTLSLRSRDIQLQKLPKSGLSANLAHSLTKLPQIKSKSNFNTQQEISSRFPRMKAPNAIAKVHKFSKRGLVNMNSHHSYGPPKTLKKVRYLLHKKGHGGLKKRKVCHNDGSIEWELESDTQASSASTTASVI
jgi:hypothetical protein